MSTIYSSTKEFKPIWDQLPIGTKAVKVKTYDGNNGDLVSVEYSLDRDDIEQMQEVSYGYFTETYTITKI